MRLLPILPMSLLAAMVLFSCPVLSQVPANLQQQIQNFDTLSSDQQQALIQQLQQVLPPDQRQAVLNGLLRSAPPATQTADQGTSASPMPGTNTSLSNAGGGPAASNSVFGPKRFAPGDTLVIDFAESSAPGGSAAAPVRSADDERALEEMRDRLEDGNPYKLDSNGQLFLPGVPAIELAGLDLDEAKVRLQSERALRPFSIKLTYLPIQPIGPDALQPFGYDLFNRLQSPLRPNTNIPVPDDYVVGPGDTVNVQLFGGQNQTYALSVSRDGTISFPQIGPITVRGLTVTQLRNTVDQHVSEQLIGVHASTTLGSLRSIQVFVLGDVQKPGSYLVDGLSTITSALYESGGVKPIGSLRDIRLMRDGRVVSRLDLYDLLLRGDTRGDERLRSGDVVFVPPIGSTVAVDGEVLRPAIYEVKNRESVGNLIELAGGMKADANAQTVKLQRIVPGHGTTVRVVNAAPGATSEYVDNGDVIHVDRNLDRLDDSVRLSGNVFRPGLYPWHSGMKLSDLLPSPELVKPKSDLNYVLIRREEEANVRVVPMSADLEAVWGHRPGAKDVLLQPRDTVYVFNLDVGRQHIVGPLLDEMQAEADSNQPLQTVSIDGQVRAPGKYPLEPGMRVSDLLRAGGGLTPSAYSIQAELTRFEVVNGEYRQTNLVEVDLNRVLAADPKANLLLAPYDHLVVKEVPRWREQESVTIRGEVRFPGTYPIRQGETLSSVLMRAGGLTSLAFPQGSVFTREELKQREAEQLDSMANRIESDLTSVALSDPNASTVITTGRSLVSQLRSTKAVGRLVIDLNDIIAGRKGADVVLRDGDALFIPQVTQEVMVLGEVQYPTSHVYRTGLTRQDYIAMSGGLSNHADKKQIYVVRANGRVVPSGHGGRWFSRSGSVDIEPGDAIVVPLDTSTVRPLAGWQSVTQILYNIAIAFSVIKNL